MTRRKPRTLRSDESELWQRIARTARPLRARKPAKPLVADTEDAGPKAPKKQEEFQHIAFEIGSRVPSGKTKSTFAQGQMQPGKTPLNMDRAAFRKLRQGKVKPEAKVDLHGMTADAAQAALTGFIFRAHASGKRLVLVITGKGRPGTDDGPIPSRPGVLRRSLPEWLKRPPLNSVVQEWTEAHLRHGGSGAFYVYLRRPR